MGNKKNNDSFSLADCFAILVEACAAFKCFTEGKSEVRGEKMRREPQVRETDAGRGKQQTYRCVCGRAREREG